MLKYELQLLMYWISSATAYSGRSDQSGLTFQTPALNCSDLTQGQLGSEEALNHLRVKGLMCLLTGGSNKKKLKMGALWKAILL